MKSLSKKRKLQHLDLFSGIGGFSLGLETAGLVDTVGFCDIDKYCHKVLNKHWPHVPIFSDIKELNHETLKANGINNIDIITGGYPCQPFSIAGLKKGEEDPRHLWPEYFRLVKELRPTWVIGENVSGHIKQGLDTVLEDLESEGYSTRTFSISASGIGANHKRERVWILAHSRCSLREGTEFERTNANEIKEGDANQSERSSSTSKSNVANSESFFSNGRGYWKSTEKRNPEGETRRNSSDERDVANSERERLQGSEQYETHTRETETQFSASQSFETTGDHWTIEPDVGRVAHGIPNRVDRLKSLGNSLVPQIPYLIGNCIKEIEGL
jgi:DNA (cytosine-5)-methyltransferase 1